MLDWADRLHARVVEQPWLHHFTAMTRILLAVGFIIPSLPKIAGQPFTQLGTETLVGYYFDALHQSGFYYQFIGYGQLIAGLLLLLPWTATIGAFAYFPIILNIFVLTVSVDFAGTKYITALMLLANIYLLCWDYDRWRGILPSGILPRRRLSTRSFRLQGYLLWGGLFGAGAALAFLGLAFLNIAMLRQSVSTLLAGVIVSGVLFGIFVHWHAQQLTEPR